MPQGRFKIHDPEHTRIVHLRISDDLYEQLREEVEADRTTIQHVATTILRDGIEMRQMSRINKERVDLDRRAKLRKAAELIGAGS